VSQGGLRNAGNDVAGALGQAPRHQHGLQLFLHTGGSFLGPEKQGSKAARHGLKGGEQRTEA